MHFFILLLSILSLSFIPRHHRFFLLLSYFFLPAFHSFALHLSFFCSIHFFLALFPLACYVIPTWLSILTLFPLLLSPLFLFLLPYLFLLSDVFFLRCFFSVLSRSSCPVTLLHTFLSRGASEEYLTATGSCHNIKYTLKTSRESGSVMSFGKKERSRKNVVRMRNFRRWPCYCSTLVVGAWIGMGHHAMIVVLHQDLDSFESLRILPLHYISSVIFLNHYG